MSASAIPYNALCANLIIVGCSVYDAPFFGDCLFSAHPEGCALQCNAIKNILCRKVENSKEVMVLNSDFKFMLRKKIPSYDSIAEFLLLA